MALLDGIIYIDFIKTFFYFIKKYWLKILITK